VNTDIVKITERHLLPSQTPAQFPKAKEAKETKPAKSGIAKRTPVEALSVKLSRAKF
jgi:hypothetical protein